MKILFLIIFLPFTGLTQVNDIFELKTKVDIQFMGWGCDCPSWIEVSDLDSLYIEDSTLGFEERINKYCFNIEANIKENEIDFKKFWSLEVESNLELEGSFYKVNQNWPGDDRVIKTRVFQYESYKFIKK